MELAIKFNLIFLKGTHIIVVFFFEFFIKYPYFLTFNSFGYWYKVINILNICKGGGHCSVIS